MPKKSQEEIDKYNEANPDSPLCELCGNPMPKGEEMFRYHGYSSHCPGCDCPKTEWHTEQVKEEDNA